jgi:hypothetical protein
MEKYSKILATMPFIDYCKMLKTIACNLEFALHSVSVLLCEKEKFKPSNSSTFVLKKCVLKIKNFRENLHSKN